MKQLTANALSVAEVEANLLDPKLLAVAKAAGDNEENIVLRLIIVIISSNKKW
jgi:hypothetical protein